MIAPILIAPITSHQSRPEDPPVCRHCGAAYPIAQQGPKHSSSVLDTLIEIAVFIAGFFLLVMLVFWSLDRNEWHQGRQHDPGTYVYYVWENLKGIWDAVRQLW